MTFFARPDLSDIQFKQLTDSVLTLSGTTRIASVSGLSLIGDGGYIPLVATGETVGYVMTYDSTGVIKLAESTISGATLPFTAGTGTITRFCNNTEYNVNVSASTVTSFLEEFFFPPLPPSTSVLITNPYSGGSISAIDRQFGDYSSGCYFCWSVTCNTYPICSILASTDGAGGSCTIYSGAGTGTTSGCTFYTVPATGYSASTSACTQTLSVYAITATSTNNEVATGSTIISWRNKRYDFNSATLYDSGDTTTIEAIANALPSTSLSGGTAILATGKTMCCTIPFTNQFFYYMYPKTMGTPYFCVNGLPNNAWGCETIGTLFTITFTNSNNYDNQYYVARSDSRITGTYVISVT